MLSTFVTVNQAPPAEGWSSINSVDGSGNLEYYGLAKSKQANLYTFTVTSVSTANPAVVAITAHGMQAGNAVKISGATGDWAALNGVQLITIVNANSFSVPVDSTLFSGTFNGTISTFAPRTNAACWAIQRNFYDGSGNLSRATWACDLTGTGGSPAPIFAWDSRTTYPYA